MTAQTFVDGAPLAGLVRPEDFSNHAKAVTDWSIDLARATRVKSGPPRVDDHRGAEIDAAIGPGTSDRLADALDVALAPVDFCVAATSTSARGTSASRSPVRSGSSTGPMHCPAGHRSAI